VTLKLEMETPDSLDLVMRLPAWAADCRVSLNGRETRVHVSKSMPGKPTANGLNFNAACWMRLSQRFYPGDEIKLDFDMPIKLAWQDKRVRGCGGKAAVTRGPVVYCLESVDHNHDIFNTKLNLKACRPFLMKPYWMGRGCCAASPGRGKRWSLFPICFGRTAAPQNDVLH
jgi:DUF1680 family protein